ncbi:MAG: hypothetical protein AAGD33_06860 [Actinomycetota bacterium]
MSEPEIIATGRRIVRRRFATVGAGLGSLAMVHLWRLAGVGDRQMVAIGPLSSPSETYEYLAHNSQIPRHERLRSDSGSTIDAIWGWPGYALRESVETGNPAPALRVLTEPLVVEYFTPQAGQVYRSVERETARLGWERIHQTGWVHTIRRAVGGGYWILVDSVDDGALAIAAEHVHVAVGYPGVALLPDLQEFRTRHPEAGFRIVNAYEPHRYLYDELARRPSVVLVRGSGIVASRVLQRLLDAVENDGHQTRIVHLFRNYVDGPQGSSRRFRRPGGRGFAYQAFNYPKSCWGGQLRQQLERVDGDERADLIDRMGGTNTAPRASWRRQLARHATTGAYTQAQGVVTDISPSDHHVRVSIRTADGATDVIDAAYVLDATGLQADVTTHPLYADLIARSGARRNPKGRLAVEPTFEIVGTRSGSGRMYAAGAMTLGGAYAGVDSFLGLQYAALQAADDMADLGALPRIGPWRSARGWCAWALGRPTQPDRRYRLDRLDRRDGRNRADRRRRSAVVAS